MFEQGVAISAACAAHLGIDWPTGMDGPEENRAFNRMLDDLADPALPPSTFTDLALAILFSLSQGFGADVTVTLGAFRGVGARALTVGRLVQLARGQGAPVQELLCDIDPACGSQLGAHRDRSLGAFAGQARQVLETGYTSVVSHTPAPDVLAQMPPGARYLALIDIDSPETGKAGYATAAQRLIETRPGEGLLIFHDVCVPRFADDIAGLQHTLAELGVPYQELAIDACGLGVAYVA